MIAGFVGSAFSVNAGFWVLTLCACVYYAGCGLMYSPLVATVLDTLPVDQSGRGVGMNDLVMNVTAARAGSGYRAGPWGQASTGPGSCSSAFVSPA